MSDSFLMAGNKVDHSKAMAAPSTKPFVQPPPSAMTPKPYAVSAQDIRILRDRSGAGLAECKEALDETHGDLNAALSILKAKGNAVVIKATTLKEITGNSDLVEGDPAAKEVTDNRRVTQSWQKAIDNLTKVTGLKREVCDAALNISGGCSHGAFNLLVQAKQIFGL